MLIRCVWCRPPRIIGQDDVEPKDATTDGMCKECEAKFWKELEDDNKGHEKPQ